MSESTESGPVLVDENGRAAKAEVLNVRALAKQERTTMERALDRAAAAIAHPLFFLAEAVFHVGWIVANLGLIPRLRPWDPYPFGFLAGLASAQALFIALLILMQTRQESTTSEVREEMDLQVALHAEREISKLIRMLAEVQRGLNIPTTEHDRELEVMSDPVRPDFLMQKTEERLAEEE